MTIKDLKHFCFFAILFGCILSSCHREQIEPIPPSEFSKLQRETLGDILEESIDLNKINFRLLPKEAPYDTIYWFVQTLYNQATNVMRIDHQSPSDNRWANDRIWNVNIIVSDQKNAFILPGGVLYLTTGLLNALKEEYELYYILSFEANLMNEGILLERLVGEVNSTKLADIVARNTDPEHKDVTNITEILSALEFETTIVQTNDIHSIHSICNTSRWDRKGLLPLLNAFDNNVEWFTYRPSYDGRTEWLVDFEPESIADCGILRTNNASGEGYQRYILDMLN